MLVNLTNRTKAAAGKRRGKGKGVRRQLVIKVKLLRLPKITKQAK
jgi:hypothetical protein